MRAASDANNGRRWQARLALLILLATLGINLLSAYIRHVEAGLGCTPWPACYAVIGAGIAEHGERIARSALAPEPIAKQTHRAIATALVVLILLLVHRSREARGPGGLATQLPLAMAGLLLVLAVIGPASYLKTRPAIAAANLLGGMALAALCWRLYLSLRTVPRVAVTPGLYLLSRCSLGVLCAQLALGAWLAANFAALGCDAQAGCAGDRGISDAFWYFRELRLDDGGRVIMDGASALIRQAHLAGAGVTLALLLLTAIGAARVASLRGLALLLIALLLVQALLGLGALRFSLPLAIVLAHGSVAALLLFALLRLACGIERGGPP